jgi:hypothetical protein
MLEETKVVDIKQDSANSISEYFKKLLDKDVNVLMADGFEHKKDYLEIPLSALSTCIRIGVLILDIIVCRALNIVSYIKDDRQY